MIEPYKHYYAKQLFKQWCNSKSWTYQNEAYRIVPVNCLNNKNTKEILKWKSNRTEFAWIDYPIVVNYEINSIEYYWDEIWPGPYANNFIPSYNQCRELKLYPISLTDIVLPHKGRPHYFIYISDQNTLTRNMIAELKLFGIENIIEIKADWILAQKCIPSILDAKLY